MLKGSQMARWRSRWASPSPMRSLARTGPDCFSANVSGTSYQTERGAAGEALIREQPGPAPVDLRASRLDPHTRGVSVHAGPRPGDANGLIRLIAAAITQFGKAHAEGEAASERSRDESTSVAEAFACSRGTSDRRGGGRDVGR